MSETNEANTVATRPMTTASVRRGRHAYEQLAGLRPMTDPIAKMMEREQEQSRSFKLLAANLADSGVRLAGVELMKGANRVDFGKAFPVPPIISQMSDYLAEQAAFREAAAKMTAQVVPDISRIAASSVATLMAAQMVDVDRIARTHLARVSGLFEAARVLDVVPRPIAPPNAAPVRNRPEVRRLLRTLHPASLRTLDGVYDVLDTRNGTGASAYSATELMKLVTFTLVSQEEVNAYMAATHSGHRRRRQALELIAIKHHVDSTILMMLTDEGQLAERLEWIKHHVHELDPTDARNQLLELIEQMEGLLVYLAQSIGR